MLSLQQLTFLIDYQLWFSIVRLPMNSCLNPHLIFLFLKTFGCACYSYLWPYKNHKLEYQSTQCTFIGYSLSHKGYLCLHHSGKVYISRSVIFYEKTFPYSSLPMNDSSPTPHTFSTSFTIPLLQTMSQTSSHPSMCPTASRPVSPSILSPPISSPSLHPMTTHSKVGTFNPKLLPYHITTCLLPFYPQANFLPLLIKHWKIPTGTQLWLKNIKP